MKHALSAAAASCVLLFGWAVHAQDYSQYYTTQHAKEFAEDFTHDLYVKGNELTAQTRAQLPNELNLAYGDDPKQRLDLYMPAGKPAVKAPVLLFIHGGGFLEGDRAHYGFIARPYASHGIITAVMSYRLTGSGAVYPAQKNDVEAAILWLHEHIASYGGDPDSLYVTGHSAGAILSAEIGMDLTWLSRRGIDTHIIKGIAPVSGPYDLRKMSEFDNYVPTVTAKADASALLHIKAPVQYVIVAYGTNNAEEDKYSVSARTFIAALRKRGLHVVPVVVTGSGHIGTAMALGTPGSPLSEAVIAMISQH